MIEAKHTPGPWKVVDREVLEDKSVYPRHIIGGVTELEICLLEGPAAAHAYVNDPAWKELGKSEMQQSNARLIEASPALLEALVDLMFRHVPFSNKADYAERARAVIAKVTGAA